MSAAGWSIVLQWSRVGIGAAVLLLAARVLTLAELGAFAAAMAPLRLMQVIHKSGVAEAAILHRGRAARAALAALSAGIGLVLALALWGAAALLSAEIGTLLAWLAPIPLLHGLGAVAEGRLRRTLRLRPLALRTLAAQSLAATIAVYTLWQGGGAMALAAFALVNAALATALALIMAGRRPAWPRRGALRAVLPAILRISARDLAAGGTIPLVQIGVGATLGLPAAGAFQLATRLLALIDALALAPIRYVSLPRFARLDPAAAGPAVAGALVRTTRLAAWLYPGALAAAPEIVTLAAGRAHLSETLPLMPGACLMGLASALSMPLTQGLTAAGETRLPLRRAIASLALGLGFAAPALAWSAASVTLALGVAAGAVVCVYTASALRRLRTPVPSAVLRPLGAGAAMLVTLAALSPAFATLPLPVALAAKVALGTTLYAGLAVAPFRRTVAA